MPIAPAVRSRGPVEAGERWHVEIIHNAGPWRPRLEIVRRRRHSWNAKAMVCLAKRSRSVVQWHVSLCRGSSTLLSRSLLTRDNHSDGLPRLNRPSYRLAW